MSIELKNYACVMCNGQTKDFKIQNKKFQLLFSNSGIGGSEISKSKIKNFIFYFQTVVLAVVRFQIPK